jgi:hypothetical protein
VLVLAAIPLLLLGFVGAFLVAVPHGCGCTSPPDPNATPTPAPPVSSSQAAVYASKLVGQTMAATSDAWPIAGVPVYQTQGGDGLAFVDGRDGRVLAAFWIDRLPTASETSGPVGRAYQAGLAFLSHAGISVDGLADSQEPARVGQVAFFDLTWTVPGKPAPSVEVLVDGSGAQVFGFRDLRGSLKLILPAIGWAAAQRAAQDSPLSQGETLDAGVEPAPFELNFSATPGQDGIGWIWYVAFQDGVLQVDAATGDVSVAKWSSR